jgi:hypothetical protein
MGTSRRWPFNRKIESQHTGCTPRGVALFLFVVAIAVIFAITWWIITRSAFY